MTQTIMVTGGAGYIGSATVKILIDNDYKVIIVDNLSNSSKKYINEKAIFYEIDLTQKDELDRIFKTHKIDAIIHFAAYKSVSESMTNPIKYSDNITGTINILNLMVKHNVKKIIYSSSAAVYGDANKEGIVSEEDPTKPLSYYGYTKLACEENIKWYGRSYGINFIIFRYFNVAGDCGLKFYDEKAENVFPILMNVVSGKINKFTIFGNNYDTPDGTCIRDYIDLNDLVHAHILALDCKNNETFNLGNSKGVSVLELIRATKEVTNKNINYEFGKRRTGDIPKLITKNEKAIKILKWSPKKSLKDMIKSTYEAYKNE